jgi:hypothetical protein
MDVPLPDGAKLASAYFDRRTMRLVGEELWRDHHDNQRDVTCVYFVPQAS